MLCRFVYLLARRFLDVLSGRFRSGDVLFERYMTRQQSIERHPGHAESATPEETRLAMGSGKADLLTMPDLTLDLDTTDLSAVAYDGLLRRIAFPKI
jgi:hypothetical protein